MSQAEGVFHVAQDVRVEVAGFMTSNGQQEETRSGRHVSNTETSEDEFRRSIVEPCSVIGHVESRTLKRFDFCVGLDNTCPESCCKGRSRSKRRNGDPDLLLFLWLGSHHGIVFWLPHQHQKKAGEPLIVNATTIHRTTNPARGRNFQRNRCKMTTQPVPGLPARLFSDWLTVILTAAEPRNHNSYWQQSRFTPRMLPNAPMNSCGPMQPSRPRPTGHSLLHTLTFRHCTEPLLQDFYHGQDTHLAAG